MMFSTKHIVNAINKSLKGKENISDHVQSIIFWHRPAISAVILGLVEIIFVFIRFSKCKASSILCMTLAAFAVGNVAQKVFPHLIDKFFSFSIPEIPDNQPNRIRRVTEVAAYITTVLSLFTGIIQFVLSDFSLVRTIISVIALSAVTIMFTVLGDFWSIFIFFHVIFVLPGILLHPKVYKAVFNHQNEENEDDHESRGNAGNDEHEKKDKDETLDAPPPTICDDDAQEEEKSDSKDDEEGKPKVSEEAK